VTSVTLDYIRFEVVRGFRNRDALLFRLGLPAGLYVVFRAVISPGSDGTTEGLPSDVAAMVAFAVFGALYSALFASGPPLAKERAIGWLRQLRVTPLPAGVAVAGKVATAMAFALPSIVLVALAAAFTQDVRLGVDRWLVLALAIWLAATAFTALGVLIGLAIADPEAAQSATSAALIAMWLFGGLVTSPSDLPAALETLADGMPPNAAGELGWAAARGDAVPLSAVAVLAVWTAALGALAALAWRRLAGAR
jgi:ABC-2 type transport system permease protein